jgi:pimeloyl-ACP methyl ester carboxylesterase
MNEISLVRIPFCLDTGPEMSIQGELLHLPDHQALPVVIVCHSFMAFREWGFFPHVAQELAGAGFATLTFDFSLNGVAEGGRRITDFASFERNTVSQELSDLGSLLDALHDEGLGGPAVDTERIALLGHSRGGGVGILRAALDRRVSALVTWSAIASFDRWTHHQKQRWRSLGFLPLARDTIVSPLRLGIGLLEDIESHRDEFDLRVAAAKIEVPWLIIHGEADLTVPPREARELYDVASHTRAELEMLGAVGHLYNATSFDEDEYRTLNRVLTLTSHWLSRHL